MLDKTDIRRADEAERLAFAKAMLKAPASGFETGDGMLDYFQAPWKFAREYAAWVTLNRPWEADPTWDRFRELVWQGEPALREFLTETALAEQSR